MPDAVIFDMDGVIVDTEPISDKFYAKFIRDLGAEPPADFRRFQGMNARSFWEILAAELSLKHEIEDLMHKGSEGYLEFINSIPDLKTIYGVADLIARLSDAGIRLALASSGNSRRVDSILEKTDLRKMFPVVVHGQDVVHGKPAPDIFLLAAQRLGVVPAECVVIEDSTHGILAANAAGMKSIGFAGLPHNKQDLSGADAVISDFAEVTPVFLEALYA
jgi:HAD superfamily hydrolase (TIGR01509 family)